MVLNRNSERTKKVIQCLLQWYKKRTGIFSGTGLPETVLPKGVQSGSDEHIMFITMCSTMDYSRNADGSLYDADAANERYFQSQLALRTRVRGYYVVNNRKTFLQRYTNEKIDRLYSLVNGQDTDQVDKGTGKLIKKFLSPASTRRYFSSYTYDDGGRTDESFLEARDMGDWEWKEDDNGFLWYDRRFKKHRLT